MVMPKRKTPNVTKMSSVKPCKGWSHCSNVSLMRRERNAKEDRIEDLEKLIYDMWSVAEIHNKEMREELIQRMRNLGLQDAK